jgi:hypothetical protein
LFGCIFPQFSVQVARPRSHRDQYLQVPLCTGMRLCFLFKFTTWGASGISSPSLPIIIRSPWRSGASFSILKLIQSGVLVGFGVRLHPIPQPPSSIPLWLSVGDRASICDQSPTRGIGLPQHQSRDWDPLWDAEAGFFVSYHGTSNGEISLRQSLHLACRVGCPGTGWNPRINPVTFEVGIASRDNPRNGTPGDRQSTLYGRTAA